MPDSGQIISLAAIVVPLAALVVVELGRGSPGPLRRYYGRFAAFGCAHGFVLWVLFVWGNWHGAPDSWIGLTKSVALFLVGASGVLLVFALGYVAVAFVLQCLRSLRSR